MLLVFGHELSRLRQACACTQCKSGAARGRRDRKCFSAAVQSAAGSMGILVVITVRFL
jgi:hypothetical protein